MLKKSALKLLAGVLSVLFLLSSMPIMTISAETEGDFEYSIADGKVRITDYLGSATDVTIPDTIAGCPVTSIGRYAFLDCPSIESITIPDSIIEIGLYAFSNCTNLDSVYISDIAAWCNIVFAVDSYSNPLYYADNLYLNGELVKDIVVPYGVTQIPQYAFSCISLESITIPNSVTSIGDYAFSGCKSLKNITIPNSVTHIGWDAFDYCINLESVYISDVAAWCNIYFAFYASNPLFYADNLYLNNALVKDIVVPYGVTQIPRYAFSCPSLENITIPESVTSIGDYAFYYCEKLKSLTIPESVTSIGEKAFYNTAYYNNADNWEEGVLYIDSALIEADESISGSYDIKPGTTIIAEYAFDECTSLISIVIPESVTSIGWCAFHDCTSLECITIPESVTSIGYFAFYNTAYYNNADNWEDGVLYIDSALIEADESISGNYDIKPGTTIIADDAFDDCISLNSITIPEGITSIGEYAFDECTSLISIVIPESVTSIGDYAFTDTAYYDNSSNWTNGVLYIDNALIETLDIVSEKYTIKEGTTVIADDAFYYYTSLTSIVVPDSVTSIGRYAFDECESLTDVYYEGTEKQWNDIDIAEGNEHLSNAKIHFNCNQNNELPEWKNLYIDYIENELLSGYCSYDRYDIVYLDDDNIPEIMLFSSSAIPGNAMLWISDGKVNVMDNLGYGECLYIEREGVTRISYINHGNYAYGIYLLEQGEFKELHRGRCWNKWDSDFSGTKEGTFEWDGESLSEEEYYNKLEQAFDVSKATKATYNQPITDLPDAIKQFVQDNVDTENTSKSFATYFVDFLEPYYDKMINVDMPCQTIIANGGVEAVYWNTFLLSLKSLPDFKLGVDEKSFYEAILFDLITDTVSSVDYEKEMKKQTMDMVNMLVDFLIDKGVDVSKENCSKADLDDMYTALSDYWFAKDIQMTKEVYDAFADGCNNAEDCIEKISVYAVAMQQSQNLVEALKLMSKESEKDSNAKTLKSALDEMVDLMNMEPLECVNYVLDEKVIEMGTDAAVSVICNFALDTIKEVFPIDKVLDCIKVADWGSNLIYPTSLSSEQQYRIYALYHVEDIARQSFATAWSNYQNNKTEENANIVNSCYDMFVRIYEHEIIECEALAELIYKKGILNGIKNYFSSNSMDDYYFAVDWVKSYNANLEIMKNCKYNAYLSWGIAYDKLEPVIYVSVIDGKVVNYTVSGADVGSTVYFPDFSQANKIINRTKLKYIGDFEGWYYDEDCTSPCFANNAVANEPIVRYAKFSSRNGKKIQVKCPVNVEVYDSDNVLCVKIEDNKTVVDNGSLSVVITDSCKEIFVPDGQYYTVNLTAFDDGVMNYSVTEINNSIATKRVNFYDVSLYDGQVYNGQVEPENNLPKESYALTTLSDNGETIVETADEELYKNEMQTLDIAVVVEGNGCASNGALVTKGDYVKLSATPDEAESFLGWYSNDNIISSECDFSFIAKEGMNIVAKFTADGQSSSGTETTDPTEPVVIGLLGDATEDGKVNIKDATLIQKSIANLTELTETGGVLADTDLNTKINIKDATAIQKHIAGIETGYPISKPKTK